VREQLRSMGCRCWLLGGGMSRYAARCWRRWGLGNITFWGLRWRPWSANWRIFAGARRGGMRVWHGRSRRRWSSGGRSSTD
jgi:hypothetical protein